MMRLPGLDNGWQVLATVDGFPGLYLGHTPRGRVALLATDAADRPASEPVRAMVKRIEDAGGVCASVPTAAECRALSDLVDADEFPAPVDEADARVEGLVAATVRLTDTRARWLGH